MYWHEVAVSVHFRCNFAHKRDIRLLQVNIVLPLMIAFTVLYAIVFMYSPLKRVT
jgi:hypothetical protein